MSVPKEFRDKTLWIVNDHWFYLGEGAAHLVLQYRGTEDSLQGHVLRVPKTNLSNLSPEQTMLDRRMIQMLGSGSVYVPKCYQIEIENPEELLKIQTLRKSKSWNHLDTALTRFKSFLMEDASYIPSLLDSITYSFELKPKWGDLPKNPLSKAEKVMCRHCIQQYQKLRMGKVKEISQFCPIQLFGDSKSQLTALMALFQTPQNNFVFRVNGEHRNINEMRELPFPWDKAVILEELTDLCDAEMAAEFMHSTLSHTEQSILLLVLQALQHSHILDLLKHIQNVSDMNDRMAMDAYNSLKNNPSSVRIREALNEYVISRGAQKYPKGQQLVYHPVLLSNGVRYAL
ncbi:hypothetical protein WA171_000540 [Blastocystis sp. BT1]